MYLRHSRVRKNGRTHTYWRLVRSVRRNGKVVQETVAQLGELDAEGRAKAKALARQITGRGDQRELFEQAGPTGAVAVEFLYVLMRGTTLWTPEPMRFSLSTMRWRLSRPSHSSKPSWSSSVTSAD